MHYFLLLTPTYFQDTFFGFGRNSKLNLGNIKVLLIISYLLSAHLQANEKTQVDFIIDMRPILGLNNMAPLDVAIRGNISPLSWSQNNVLLQDEDQDGIYQGHIIFERPTNNQLEFKAVAAGGRIWEQGEPNRLDLDVSQFHKYSAVFNHPQRSDNPFNRFIGNWNFDDQGFSIVWDGAPEVNNRYANQITECNPINHDRSILCLVSDKTDPFMRGHMLWSYNQTTQEVSWLSHFFPGRNGVGSGKVDKQGNLKVKVIFENEPAGTYRIYEWIWVNEHSYKMTSRQYQADGTPTGDWYGGTSVRR
jgi:hypothetical protein